MRRIAALLLLLASPALAHGDAWWIQEGGYIDRNGTHCCGPTDCEVAKPGELARIPGGWLHVPTQTTIMDNEVGTYISIDAQLWRCVRGGQLKCVFPGAGL